MARLPGWPCRQLVAAPTRQPGSYRRRTSTSGIDTPPVDRLDSLEKLVRRLDFEQDVLKWSIANG